MEKQTVTISICVPKHIVETLDNIAKDTNVSRSSVITAMLSLAIKWKLIK